jgi:Protein of unknown function (DUF3558)
VANLNRRTTVMLLLIALAVTGLVIVAACSHEPGQPRPAPSGTVSQNPTSSSTTVQSVRDLDLCTLLTPADFPVPATPGDTPIKSSSPSAGCTWTISVDNAGSTFTAGVSARAVPFSQFVPPPGSPNGRSAEIVGRPAWLGNPLSDVDQGCSAAFGAADGILMTSVTDETDRGVDPCQTVAELAEIVASRTPTPTA